MEILWNLIRDGRQDLLFPGCDRNTTVAIECDWFSAVLVSLLSLGWFSFCLLCIAPLSEIDRWIAWERNTSDCPSWALLPCSEDWGRRPKFLRRIKIGIGRGCLLPVILFRLSEIIFGGIAASFPLRERTQVHLCHTKEKFIRNEDGPLGNEYIHITAVTKWSFFKRRWNKFTLKLLNFFIWSCVEVTRNSCFGSCTPAILFHAGVAVSYLEFKNPGKRTSQSESEMDPSAW